MRRRKHKAAGRLHTTKAVLSADYPKVLTRAGGSANIARLPELLGKADRE
jgi:hypothetical protein